MFRGLGLAAAMVLVAGAATAADRPLFEFRGEVPAPGGTVRLEARCAQGSDGVSCRAGSQTPSGRGFEIEGRFRLAPPEPPKPEPTTPSQSGPRWF